jgi:hypothetical protein
MRANMKMPVKPDHRALAEALRRRVLEGLGETSPQLRQAEAAYRVTDAQVSAVLTATGSEKATFEIIAAAALGAGLLRWEQAMKVLDEVTNASA